ncbi:MBL fold metallo-hydrolase [Dehalococcoidia bacterium]|nr:MBL fold metallo-hydrolase [Dehalococcoidia bacterium]
MPSSTTIEHVNITRYVQSTFKMKVAEKVVWIDPIMVNAEQIGNDKADLILLTHEHGDHFSVDSINAVSKKGTSLICNNSGIINKIHGNVSADVSVMKEGDTLESVEVRVRAVAGYNDIHPRNDGHDSFNIGFVFTLGGLQILHTGDTGLIDEFSTFGKLDIAMVPIGGTYTMDEIESALAITNQLKPRIAIPMHYGFATGGDPKRFRELIGDAAQVEILDAMLSRS